MDVAATLEPRSGGCLCGAVRFSARPAKREVEVCHCSKCRRNVGGPLMSVHVAQAPVFENEDAIGVYGSSDWGERGFCAKCGTSLFWRMRDGSMWNVNAGTFDDLSDMDLGTQIYIDEKPGFYDFAQQTPKLTGAEVIALFTQDGDEQGESA